MKYIEELIAYKEDIDAIEIAEILWLSQFMGSESSKVEEGLDLTSDRDEEEGKEPIDETLPPIEESERVDNSYSSFEDEKQKYTFDKERDSSSIYATHIAKREKFPKIERQFQSLKVKQKRTSKRVLDEVKTADYIANSGYFHPIFGEAKSKESYFSLHIVIDRSESIFLWESYAQHFIKSIKFATIFTHIHIFELDSSQKEPSISAINSNYPINPNSAIFREPRSLTLVFSDITGSSWKSNRMFEVLDMWSKGSFVTIVSMLPKRMWKKTPLRQGISIFMKPTRFLPQNRDLKAEFDFMGIKANQKSTNIPLLTFDSYAFGYLSDVLMSKKDSWIDTRIFKNLVIKEVAKPKKSDISVSQRVKNFFSFALPKTRELAIYCSVLPLNQEIIREVIKVRDLGSEKDVFAEFYFGGLLDRDAKASLGEYAFYDGVAKELRQYISVQEIEILLHQVKGVMSSSFGIDSNRVNLLFESADSGEELNDNERALVEMMIEVLGDKGRFYEDKISSLGDIVIEKSNIQTSIVKIETLQSYGVGVLINYYREDGYSTIVTTKHLLYNEVGELLDAKINNKNIDLNKIDSIESSNLAICKIRNQSTFNLLNIETEESKIGTSVSIVTYNDNIEYIYKGKITSLNTNAMYQFLIDSYEITLLDVNISLLSGSAVIDTITNKLIGIVSMLDTQNNIIQATPIKKLLNKKHSWKTIVENEQKKPYFKKLQKFLDKEEKLGKNILPSKELWYSSLDSTELSDVKVVILGQDPYPTVGYAHGLAFSILDDVKPLPKSLININKELFSDLGIDNSHTGYLQPWAEQGVLLLNSVLTVEEGKSNSHQGRGWEIFTDKIIETINRELEGVVFLLWGGYAQKKGASIDTRRHLVIKSPHPSPLSAYRGFFGSKFFSKIDKYLEKYEVFPVEWNFNPKIISGGLSEKQISYFKYILNKRKKELQIKSDMVKISEIENIIDEVNSALKRIEDNRYGICKKCDNSINIRRLEVIPSAKYCIDCQETIEKIPYQLTSKLGKGIIIGRIKELKEIDMLLNESSLLLINGIGGIGKSTLASYYLHTQKDKLDYYGFFEGLDSFILELYKPLVLQQEKENNAFMEAISKLKELKGHKLLVFDDIKEIEKNQEKIEKILALKDYGYKILLTSREGIDGINQYYLNMLSLKDAKELFLSIYEIEDENILEEILTYLDFHALFVEMTAKTLKSRKNLTPQIIIDKFKNGDFSTIKSKRKESFADYLNQLFTFDELADEEILILKQLSILPSIKIQFEFLQEIFDRRDEEFEEVLDYLSEKGWLESFENRYKLSQITKEYILSNHLPNFKEIKQIIEFFYNSKAKYLKNNLFYIESINNILNRIGKIDEFYNDNIFDTSCDLCRTKLNNENFFIDGQIKNSGGKWGNVCLNCFEEQGIQIGKGIGQLYKKQSNKKWLLLAGWDTNLNKTHDSNIKFHFLKANTGEGIIVSTEDTNIIIDGGTAQTYQRELKSKIEEMNLLDLVIFTHRDNDHAGGLLKLIEDARNREKIKEIWFNGFFKKEEVRKSILSSENLIQKYNIPYKNNIFLHEESSNQSYRINDIELQLLSPVKQDNRYMRGKKDISIENNLSIAFILKYQNKKFLFLADASVEVINYSLKRLGYSKENRLNVEFVKLSHGGSIRNIDSEFLDMINTNKFVILTDGKWFNFPHKETLELILTHELQAESIEFICNYQNVLENKLTEKKVMKYNCRLVYTTSMSF